MKLKYKLDNENFHVTFCSGNLAVKPKKITRSYMEISKNLNQPFYQKNYTGYIAV